jgi:hypothetical protein
MAEENHEKSPAKSAPRVNIRPSRDLWPKFFLHRPGGVTARCAARYFLGCENVHRVGATAALFAAVLPARLRVHELGGGQVLVWRGGRATAPEEEGDVNSARQPT